MQKIADIRKNRESRFWKNRMKLAKRKKVKDIRDELTKHSDLISNKQLKEQI